MQTSCSTGRERILTTLEGKIADRVPVSPFVQEEFLSYIYPERDRVDRVYDGAECAREFGFDLMARPKKFERPDFLKRSYPSWEVSVGETKGDGQIFKTTTIQTPARTLRSVEAGPDCGAATAGIHLSTIEYLLKNKEDIEAFVEYLPMLSRKSVDDMHSTALEWKEIIGDIGIVVPWGWGTVYNNASELRNVELLMMDAYLEPELYRLFMNKIAEAQVEFNIALVQAGIECIGLQGNIANGAMVGYDFFKEYIQPYEQKVVNAIKAEGAYVLYHNCGYATALYNNYIEMGLTVWETVAALPQGDNDLAHAKESIGKHMCIMGNIDQVSFLKKAATEEVVAKTEEIVSIGKPEGRYIFAASDFLERDTPLDNIKVMIRTAETAGRY